MTDAFGLLPNSVALDMRLSAGALALLAYRVTRTGQFALNLNAAARGLPMRGGPLPEGRTIGRTRFKKLIAELVVAGYLHRKQPPSRGRNSFEYATETLELPSGHYRVCYERWHDGTWSEAAIAALIYIRAHNCAVSLASIRGRFNWSRGMASRAVKELIAAGAAVMPKGRNGGYADAEKAIVQNRSHDKASNDTPSYDRPSHTHRDRLARKDRIPLREQSAQMTGNYPFRPSADNGPSLLSEIAEAAWLSDRLLGWANAADDQTVADILRNVSDEALADCDAVMSDSELLFAADETAGHRIHRDILTPQGAYALRVLSATLVDAYSETPERAIAEVLHAIKTRIGNKPDAWLNSLKLIGMRIVRHSCDGGTDLFSRADEMLAVLQEADGARILCPKLAQRPRALAAFVNQFDDREGAIASIRTNLRSAMVTGKAPGSVKTCEYFRSAIESDAKAVAMAHAGIRPGDVLGCHRTKDF
ncbi:MAG: hypothetical protein AB7U75_21715 [Hyphomicrobiaceae bacterium]